MKLIFQILSFLSLSASVIASVLLFITILESKKYPDAGWGIGPLLILIPAFLILPFIFFKQTWARIFIILFAFAVVGGTNIYFGIKLSHNEKQRQVEITNFKQNNGEYNITSLPKNWVNESSRLDSSGLHKTYRFGNNGDAGFTQSATSFSANLDDLVKLDPRLRSGNKRLITKEDVTIGADNGIYFVSREVDPGVNIPDEKFSQIIIWGDDQTTFKVGVTAVKEEMLTKEELISIAQSVKRE